MKIYITIRYKNPIGVFVEDTISEFSLQKLFRFGLVRPWDYHLRLFGYSGAGAGLPSCIEFVYNCYSWSRILDDYKK